MYNTYSSIIKYTGGLLIDSAGKIRAIYMAPYNVNYSIQISILGISILAAHVYYNFDYYYDIGWDLYKTYFTTLPFDYGKEWRKYHPIYPMTPNPFTNTTLAGGAQNKKKYLHKYLKYKHKYLQLKY